jgi:hypothetical protein
VELDTSDYSIPVQTSHLSGAFDQDPTVEIKSMRSSPASRVPARDSPARVARVQTLASSSVFWASAMLRRVAERHGEPDGDDDVLDCVLEHGRGTAREPRAELGFGSSTMASIFYN